MALFGVLTACGLTSTADAHGWGYGPRYRPHYGYGWRPGPYYPYGYRPYVAPGVVIGGPRISVGIGAGYAYPPPPPVYVAPYPYYGY